jgi:probable DNA metabolism protein
VTGMLDRAMEAKLAGQTDLAGFRSEARQLLARQVPPDEVHWQFAPAASPYADGLPQAARPRNVARAAAAIVPASFTRLCEFVVLHRDPDRFALLYRLLWRLVHEPGLRNDPIDADMLQAQHMAHAVRRDIHKMKANLRLRSLHDAQGRELQVGCHEPAHHIVEAVATWFGKRIAAPRWAIFTPERSVRCDDGVLLLAPGGIVSCVAKQDASDAEWLALYQQVFAAHDGAAGATLTIPPTQDGPAAHA